MNIMPEIENFVRTKLPEWFIESHVKIVVNESLELQKSYPSSDKEIIVIAAWLHDVGHEISEKPGYDRNSSDHHIVGEQISRNFLTSINYDTEKMEHVLQCILSHRTSKPPEPISIEAKIVFSADNIAHFSSYEKIVEVMGVERFLEKLERNLGHKSFLPEAKKRAIELLTELRSSYQGKGGCLENGKIEISSDALAKD